MRSEYYNSDELTHDVCDKVVETLRFISGLSSLVDQDH